jgi:hypothetical protein
VPGVPHPSDLTHDQWDLLEPVSNTTSKRGRKHADDLRTVVDALFPVAAMVAHARPPPRG